VDQRLDRSADAPHNEIGVDGAAVDPDLLGEMTVRFALRAAAIGPEQANLPAALGAVGSCRPWARGCAHPMDIVLGGPMRRGLPSAFQHRFHDWSVSTPWHHERRNARGIGTRVAKFEWREHGFRIPSAGVISS